jgi:hypothetical protein
MELGTLAVVLPTVVTVAAPVLNSFVMKVSVAPWRALGAATERRCSR